MGPGPGTELCTPLILGNSAILSHDENSELGFGRESQNPWDEKLAGNLRPNCCSVDTFLYFKRHALSDLHSSAFVM